MIALIASFFSLFVGPLVYQTFGPMRRTDKIVTGIVMTVVAGTILLEVLPTAYQSIGLVALALCILGFSGPTIIEKTFKKAADTTHKLTSLLGISGLLVHAFMDGIVIQSAQATDANGLSLAIILHRLPVGLTIWWLLKPLLGERYALVTLFLMGIATLLGYASSVATSNYQDSTFFSVIQAFIAGSLLHVVIHKPHSDGCLHTNEKHDLHHHSHEPKKKPLFGKLTHWELLGMLLGITILLIMHYFHV
jgi:zinc transporter ZupT